MDDTDRELISLLRDDARMPVVALAKKLRIARATVQNRLARLEQAGTIQGYTLRLMPAAEGYRIRALLMVAVEGNRAAEVLQALRGHPNVFGLRTTNGLERINREIKRRTRVASIFPNTASCLRLVSALLAECDEDWMTGKIYLNLKD